MGCTSWTHENGAPVPAADAGRRLTRLAGRAGSLIARLWQARMKTKAEPLRDPKTVLQEWAQGRGLPTPAYREIARSGPDHDPQFRVAVQLPHLAPAEGSGRSKRAAEQAAAAAMMKREGVKPERLDG